MKYRGIKARAEKIKFSFVLIDEEHGELMECGRCGSTAPLHAFDRYYPNQGVDPFCNICASTTEQDINISRALNALLLTIGAFDDVDVITIEEAGLVDYWDMVLE